MKLIQQAEAVFRDIEKLYKLMSVYGGDVRQFQRQVDFIDSNFVETLRNPVEQRFAFTFDLLMTVVYFEGQEVFRAEKPEYTLAHALFSEGIKSLVVHTSLRSKELVDWMSEVRNYLMSKPDDLDSETGEQGNDLASMLWRQESANIQVELYNNLASMQGLSTMQGEQLEDFDEDWEAYKVEFMHTHATTFRKDQWVSRDEQWSLPSGDLVGDRVLPEFDSEKVPDRLKRELADLSFSEKAERIVLFSPDELGQLKSELSHYDVNQIDFNLIVQLFLSAEKFAESAPPPTALGDEIVNSLQAVLGRFHAPLMLYVLKRIVTWKENQSLTTLYQRILTMMRDTLKTREMAEQVAEAFTLASRAELATELLAFSNKESWFISFEYLAKDKRRDGEKRFLQGLANRGFKLMDVIFEWKSSMIIEVLEVLPAIKSTEKEEIFNRALHSGSSDVRQKAIERLPFMEMPLDKATALFGRLPPQDKQEWLGVLAKTNPSDKWRPFAQYLLKSDRWFQLPDRLRKSALDLILNYQAPQAISQFEELVTSRKFFLFPKFPKRRELILEAYLRTKDSQVRSKVGHLLDSEAGVLFQSPQMKKSLKER